MVFKPEGTILSPEEAKQRGKEKQALRAAIVMYLAEQGTPAIETYELGTLELLRTAAEAHIRELGAKGVVSIHFENDNR